MNLTASEQKALNRIGIAGFRGVRASGQAKKPWLAEFTHKGKTYYGGCHESAREAAIAYDNLVIKVVGDKAITNKKLGLLEENEIEKTDLSDYLLEIAGEFILYLDKRKSKTGKFLEFSKAKLRKKISLKEVWQILLYLEEKGLALLSNKQQQPNLIVVRFISKPLKQHIEQQKQKETTMEKVTDLTQLPIESLKMLAKQAEELARTKEQEGVEKDALRKTLNPLILNAVQAKGKYERKLNELLDISTELDNALNALKDALK